MTHAPLSGNSIMIVTYAIWRRASSSRSTAMPVWRAARAPTSSCRRDGRSSSSLPSRCVSPDTRCTSVRWPGCWCWKSSRTASAVRPSSRPPSPISRGTSWCAAALRKVRRLHVARRADTPLRKFSCPRQKERRWRRSRL